MASARASERLFLGISSLLFTVSTIATIVWCRSMAGGGMPMPGGWTMSMAWMRMPTQSWPAAAASFLGMWLVMMVAMMLPSLVPALRRYRHAIGGAAATGRLTVVAGAAYFSVWVAFGAIVFSVGVALAAVAMQRPSLARAVPLASGTVVLIAGALQFTAWKRHHLACCRESPARGAMSAGARAAWRHGLRLGAHCSLCTAGLTAILLVAGVMDLRAMAAVTAAMTIERLAGDRAARAIGVVIVACGLVLIARAAGVR